MTIQQERVTQSIVGVARRHLSFPHYRLFCFGSRAGGQARPRSDYDIGIEADRPIPLEVMARIRQELEEVPILQKIDLVDFSSVSDTFRRQALQSARVIYEQ